MTVRLLKVYSLILSMIWVLKVHSNIQQWECSNSAVVFSFSDSNDAQNTVRELPSHKFNCQVHCDRFSRSRRRTLNIFRNDFCSSPKTRLSKLPSCWQRFNWGRLHIVFEVDEKVSNFGLHKIHRRSKRFWKTSTRQTCLNGSSIEKLVKFIIKKFALWEQA